MPQLDIELRNQWLQALGDEKIEYGTNGNVLICSLHFDEKSMFPRNVKGVLTKGLYPNALPIRKDTRIAIKTEDTEEMVEYVDVSAVKIEAIEAPVAPMVITKEYVFLSFSTLPHSHIEIINVHFQVFACQNAERFAYDSM